MIFVSAQPDTTYFHWQVSLYLYQFAKHGISDRCYALFGYTGSKPSDYVLELAKQYPNVIHYKDTRKSTKYSPSTRKSTKYSPTIRPHCLAKFFRQYPHLGKKVFYHDSDIFLTKLPRFDLMLEDDIGYLSDTISYIGYEYIKKCAGRYKSRYRKLPDDDIFNGMCKVMEIDPMLIKNNEKNSGGAQYLLKNIDHTYWEKCETDCVNLYDYLCKYEKQHPIRHHIQKWTTDMWVVLWNYWKRGGKTVIHKELDFSWATGHVKDYHKLNIFHLAGVTSANSRDKFYKGKFTKQTVFDAYVKNPRLFDNVSRNNATYEYCKVIKEYVNEVYLPSKGIVARNAVEYKQDLYKNVDSFKLITNRSYGNHYRRDDSTKCCGKSVWRSRDNKFIIFWNNTSWILTYTKYESQIGSTCGGIGSSSGDEPYENKWNLNMMVEIDKK